MGDLLGWLTVGGAFLAAGAALWQLNLQRIQLTDQTRLQERKQANKIDVEPSSTTRGQTLVLAYPGDEDDQLHMIVVTNGSKRPIRCLECWIDVVTGKKKVESSRRERLMRSGKRAADAYGVPGADGRLGRAFGLEDYRSVKPVLRAGEQAAFVWDRPLSSFSNFDFWVRFTDDKGLDWEITTDLHLEKLGKRHWWSRLSEFPGWAMRRAVRRNAPDSRSRSRA